MVTEVKNSSGVTTTIVTLVDTRTGTTVSTTTSPAFEGRFDSLELSGDDALITYSDAGDTYLAVIDGDTGRQIGQSVELPGPRAYPAIVAEYNDHNQRVYRAVIITYTFEGQNPTTLTTIDLLTGDDVNSLELQGRPDQLHPVQYNEDRSQAYLITETPPDPDSAGTTSVTVITRGAAVAVTPTQVTVFTGQFDSLVLDPDTPDRALLLFTTETDTKGAITGTHVAIIDTNTATQIGPSIKLAGQPADTAIIWSDDGTRATLITTGLDKTGATTTLTTINVAGTKQT